MFRIAVVGTGMVGGALARCFKDPILYDKFKKIGSLKEIDRADIIFICVPTGDASNGFDISAVNETLGHLTTSKIIVIKSTILPGTTDFLQAKFKNHKFLFSPEFLTEETADQDARFPDRQIVGYTDKSYNVALDVMNLLPLAPYERIMPARIAEFIKYYGNSWFAVKVAYNNQMYDLAKKIGFDAKDWDMVIEGASADKRIGRSHLNVWHKGYRGYGGKCLPKDSKAILEMASLEGVDLSVLSETDKYNDKLTKYTYAK